MPNDFRICRPYGAWDLWATVSTKMLLLTELGDATHSDRLACTGNSSGPSLYHLLEVLGKEKVMQRIEKALGHAGFGE